MSDQDFVYPTLVLPPALKDHYIQRLQKIENLFRNDEVSGKAAAIDFVKGVGYYFVDEAQKAGYYNEAGLSLQLQGFLLQIVDENLPKAATAVPFVQSEMMDLDVTPLSYKAPVNIVEDPNVDVGSVILRPYRNRKPVGFTHCVQVYKEIDFDNPGLVVGRPVKEELYSRAVNKSWRDNWPEEISVKSTVVPYPENYGDRYKYRIVENLKNAMYMAGAEAYWKVMELKHGEDIDLRVGLRSPTDFSAQRFWDGINERRHTTAKDFFTYTWRREEAHKPEHAHLPIPLIGLHPDPIRVVEKTNKKAGQMNQKSKKDKRAQRQQKKPAVKGDEGDEVDQYGRSIGLRAPAQSIHNQVGGTGSSFHTSTAAPTGGNTGANIQQQMQHLRLGNIASQSFGSFGTTLDQGPQDGEGPEDIEMADA